MLQPVYFWHSPQYGHPMHLFPFRFSFTKYLMTKKTTAASARTAMIVAIFICRLLSDALRHCYFITPDDYAKASHPASTHAALMGTAQTLRNCGC